MKAESLNPHFLLGSQEGDHFTGSPKANMERPHVGNDNDNCACLGRESAGDHFYLLKIALAGFPGGAVVENLPANAGDTGSSPGLGRSHMPQSN